MISDKRIIIILSLLNILGVYTINTILMPWGDYFGGAAIRISKIYAVLYVLVWAYIIVISYKHKFIILLLHYASFFMVLPIFLIFIYLFDSIGNGGTYEVLTYILLSLTIPYYGTHYPIGVVFLFFLVGISIYAYMVINVNLIVSFVKKFLFLIIIFIFGIEININLFDTENQANLYNLFFSITYIILWLVLLYIAEKKKSKTSLLHFLFFWTITFIISLLLSLFFYIDTNIMIKLLISFIIHLFGITYFYPYTLLEIKFLSISFISIIFIFVILYLLYSKKHLSKLPTA